MPNIKHIFTSAKDDGGDATLIQPSNWNAEHVIDQYMDFPEIADPAVPDSTHLRVYAKDIAGRSMLKVVGQSGLDMPLQPHFGVNNIRKVGVGGTATPTGHATAFGTAFITVATSVAFPVLSTGSLLARTRRWTQSSSSLTSHRSTNTECSLETGFFFTTRFSLVTISSGNRFFFGLTDGSAAPTNIDPLSSTAVALAQVGMAINANTGNWKVLTNNTSSIPTQTDLGAGFPVNVTDFLELILYAKPNATSVGWRVTNLTSGAVATGSLASNLPASTTALGVKEWGGGSVSFSTSGWYLETDY